MLASIVALNVVAALADPNSSRVELELDGHYGYAGPLQRGPSSACSLDDACPFNGFAHMGMGTAALTVLLGPRLQDDDAPYSLQPLLQRVSALRIFGTGADGVPSEDGPRRRSRACPSSCT